MPGPKPGLRAIPTKYRGVEFRSKLEAKWACLFDEMGGLFWEHEPEGYDLPDGTRYLPDFLIRRAGTRKYCWAEVKPLGGDFTKARALEAASGTVVLELEGSPGEIRATSERVVCALVVFATGGAPVDDEVASVLVEWAWTHFNTAAMRVRGHRFWNPSRRGSPVVRLSDLTLGEP